MVNGSTSGGIIRAGAGVREIRLGTGVIIEADARPVKSGGASRAHPFRATIKPIDGNPGVSVAIGTINLLVPVGVRETTELGDDPQFIILTVNTDGRQVTSASIGLEDDTPDPPGCILGAPPLTFKVALAYVGPASSPFVEQIVFDNLIAQRQLCHQVERSPIPAGASPFENWWTWAVGKAIDLALIEA